MDKQIPTDPALFATASKVADRLLRGFNDEPAETFRLVGKEDKPLGAHDRETLPGMIYRAMGGRYGWAG